MWHPLESWEPTTLGWLLAISAVLSFLLFLRMEAVGRGLRSSRAPLGITSLAMSISARESQEVLADWAENGRADARRLLVVDSCFIPAFSTTLTILVLFAARWFAEQDLRRLHDLALILAWGPWMAGLLDFAENATLMRIVHAYPLIAESLSGSAYWFARGKFLLIMFAMAIAGFAVVSMWI